LLAVRLTAQRCCPAQTQQERLNQCRALIDAAKVDCDIRGFDPTPTDLPGFERFADILTKRRAEEEAEHRRMLVCGQAAQRCVWAKSRYVPAP
jgi:hypothetical protein